MRFKMRFKIFVLMFYNNLGAAIEKAQTPLSLRFDLATSRSSWSSDLRHRAGTWGCSISAMYGGASPFKDLKISRVNHIKSLEFLNREYPYFIFVSWGGGVQWYIFSWGPKSSWGPMTVCTIFSDQFIYVHISRGTHYMLYMFLFLHIYYMEI